MALVCNEIWSNRVCEGYKFLVGAVAMLTMSGDKSRC